MWSKHFQLLEPKFLHISNLQNLQTQTPGAQIDNNGVLNNTFSDCTF